MHPCRSPTIVATPEWKARSGKHGNLRYWPADCGSRVLLEHRRPVLRASRAHGAKSRKEARKVPGDLAKTVPSGRRKVVRVNRAGSPGRSGSRQFHNKEDMFLALVKQ